jgi:hypothetical protein
MTIYVSCVSTGVAKTAGSSPDHEKPVPNLKPKMHMRNPWIKKNPLMSMWLSGANAAAGSARSRITAESKRQAAAIMAEGTKQMVRFWIGGWMDPAPRKKKRSR